MTVRTNVQRRSANIGGSNWYGQYGDPAVIPPNSAWGRSMAGVVVNERSVVSLMAVFSCLRVLGDAATLLTPRCYHKMPAGVADVEVDPPEVVTDPYADISLRDGTFRQVASLGLNGNLVKHVVDRDSRMLPSQVELLNPGALRVDRVEGHKRYSMGPVGKVIPPEDIVHVPWVALPDGLVGLNPIEVGAMGLGIAIASEEYSSRYFAQGMHPSGILSFGKTMQQADMDRMQKKLSVEHGGLAQSFTPIVLDAEAHWESIAVSPQAAQLLESRSFSKQEIAGFYGVPMYLLGDVSDRGGTWLKGVQEMILAFVTFALSGYTQRVDEADTALCPPGYYVKRNVGELVRTNDEMLSRLIMVLRNASAASPNEIRPLVNLPRSEEEGADSLFAPLNSSQSDWAKPGFEGAVPDEEPSGAQPSNSGGSASGGTPVQGQ